MAPDYYLRRMTRADVPEVERLTDEAFFDLDVRTHQPGWPEPEHRAPGEAESWRRRMEHLLGHDPAGSFVAEDASGLLGVAAGMRRDLTWILATYVVRPGLQGRGIGKQLLAAAMSYGDGCLRAMVSSSSDPAAVRRYRLAGFRLHPMMLLWGVVARSSLPVVERVREGGIGDLDLMNSVDRQVRDAAHGVDHEVLVSTYRLVVTDRPTGSGYAYVRPEGGTYLLAATSRRAASALLWEALAASSPDRPCSVAHLTGEQEWALDVGLAARMEVHQRGYLALRHLKPPMPYLPSGHFL